MKRSTRAFLALLLAVASAAPLAAQKKGKAPVTPPVMDSSVQYYSGRQSWTSDRYRLGVGDIVTVMVNDQTLASATTSNNATDNRAKALDLSIKPPDSPTKATPEIAAKAAFNNNGDSKQSGDASRSNIFQSTLSARVVAVSPTGMLFIRGRKMVNVDRNQQEVQLSGWIRPQDIDVGTNAIASTAVADAELVVTQKGKLGAPRSGILSKVIGAIWP